MYAEKVEKWGDDVCIVWQIDGVHPRNVLAGRISRVTGA